MKILVLLLIIVLIVMSITLLIPMLLYPFANYLKFMHKYYCKIGWHCHSADYIFDSFDGASDHCTCKWCGYKGMVDSQGNLF